MRKFDYLGLHLAEYQARIFEESIVRYNCSSLVFLRRFKKSNLAKRLDNANNNVLLDINEAFLEMNSQYKETSYGKEKYSKEAMFWAGYIYRYFCYTRECTTLLAFDYIKPQELLKLYYVCHTQSEEYTIRYIFELHNYDENVFDKDYQTKQFYKNRMAN